MFRYDPTNDPFPNPRHEIVLDAEKGITMGFRWIPPGRFRMGSRGYHPSEEPVHRVEITNGFWIAETPVTQAQFRIWPRSQSVKKLVEQKIYALNGYLDESEEKFSFDEVSKDCFPRNLVTWQESIDYCRWIEGLGLTQELFPGYMGTLPTEAEWEYACRGYCWENNLFVAGETEFFGSLSDPQAAGRAVAG